MYEFPITIIEPKEKIRGLLPELRISDKFQHELDKSYITFITELYLSYKTSAQQESREWFLSEIALSLNQTYPHLSRQDILGIIQTIESHGESNA